MINPLWLLSCLIFLRVEKTAAKRWFVGTSHLPQKAHRSGSSFATRSSLSSKSKTTVTAVTLEKLRGGGVLDLPSPETIAKIGLCVLGLQDTVVALAPQKVFESLNSESVEFTPFAEYMILENAAIGIDMAILMGAQLMYGLEFQKAAGYHLIPFTLQTVHKLMTNKHAKAGMPTAYGYGLLATCLLVTYSCLAETSYAGFFLKIFGIVNFLNAPFMILAARPMVQTLTDPSYPYSEDLTIYCFLRWFGFNLLAHGGLLSLVMLRGVSPIKAFGFSWLVWAVTMSVPLFVTKECDEWGTIKGPLVGWVLFCLVCGFGILLQE